MTWGVIRFDGRTIYYEIEGEKVKAREIGGEWMQSPELLAAIEADVERQRGKG